MIADIIMPKMGESITEGTILEWRKNVGDTIEKDETLLEIGTDKVDSEIPSAHSGKIVEILAQTNDVVEVGATIARIDVTGPSESEEKIDAEKMNVETSESGKNDKLKPGDDDYAPLEQKIEIPGHVSVGSTGETRKKRFYTPVVMKIAADKEIPLIELETLTGTGRGGRVTKKDLLTYLDTRDTEMAFDGQISTSKIMGLADDRVEMDYLRTVIAEHMRRSLDTSAHVYVTAEADVSPIVDYVKKRSRSFHASEGYRLTYTPFIFHVVIRALAQTPDMNASLDGKTIVYHKHINLGMAVAVEKGLMVPVIADCEELNFLGLCRKVFSLAKRTREKKITPDELQGSTFTITNFGVFNVTTGFPIINQPNVGILGFGTIKKRAVVLESPGGDSVGIRSILNLSLGFDHRLIDGAGGSKFIDLVRRNLEEIDLENLL
ncbi:MAG: dihydrolipoamide acetyltransferase family protein [Candidatus Neomarinimicrobiota bacterium]